jgi:hypothetical protein
MGFCLAKASKAKGFINKVSQSIGYKLLNFSVESSLFNFSIKRQIVQRRSIRSGKVPGLARRRRTGITCHYSARDDRAILTISASGSAEKWRQKYRAF